MRIARWQLRAGRTWLVFFLLPVGCLVFGTSFIILTGTIYQIPPNHDGPIDARDKFTVVINTWKRHQLLEGSISHYAKCDRVDALRVVWSESDSPPQSLKASFHSLLANEREASGRDVRLLFDIRTDASLNSRFVPLPDLHTCAVLSVDDDVRIDCDSLLFAFQVWKSAQDAVVGFHSRLHLLNKVVEGRSWYKYGGWFSVWWTGSYSLVLTKAAILHAKYLEAYSNTMPEAVREYVKKNSNCEDIAMSFLVANMTSAPPIWVRGKLKDYGKLGISSHQNHKEKRSKCLNDFVDLFGRMPLVVGHQSVRDLRTWWQF